MIARFSKKAAKARSPRRPCKPSAVSSLLLLLALPFPLQAATYTWSGGGADNNWSNGANWLGGSPPPNLSILSFAGNTNTTAYNDKLIYFPNGFTFDAGAGAFTLNGYALFLEGNITNLATQHQTLDFVSGPIMKADSTISNVEGGSMEIKSDLRLNDVTVTFDGEGDTVVSGSIQDEITPSANAIRKRGSGTLTLTGANSYSGGTTISEGVLRAENDAALGNGSVTVESGGVLDLAGNITIANAITISGSGTGSGAIIGGAFNQTSTVSGNVTLGGDALLSARGSGGTLQLTGTIDTAGYTLSSAADLNGQVYLTGVVSGSGGITVNSERLYLAGSQANTFTGGVTVQGGATLELRKDADVTAVPGNVTIADGAVIARTNNQFSGDSIVTFTDNGTLGIRTYGTPLTQTIAGLQGTTGEVDVLDLVFAGPSIKSTFILSGTGSYSFGGEVSDSGSGILELVKNGSGTQTFSGANTYRGGTTIEAGTLIAGNDNALGNGRITLQSGTLGGTGGITLSNAIKVTADSGFNPGSGLFSTLTLNGNVDLNGAGRTLTFAPGSLTSTEFTGVISNDGGGGLTLARSGTSGAAFVYLSGTDSNTYTGITHVGNGIALYLDKTGATAIVGGLDIQNGAQVTLSQEGQIADTSRVDINGTGILQLGSGSPGDEAIGSLYGDGTVRLNNGTRSGVLTVTSGSFSGVITGGTTSLSAVVKTGTGTLLLTGSNSYRANLQIEGGIVGVNSDNAIGSGGITLEGGALLGLASFTTNRIVNLWDGGGALLAANGETVTFTRNFNDLGVGGNALTIGSADHQGTVVLTGTTPHTGGTTVAGGTLVANGVFSGTSAVTVQSGATLSGSGTIAGPVEIADGGVLSPGNSPGTLTLGSLVLHDASLLNFELNTPGVVGGGVNDLIAVTGDLTLDGIVNLSSGSLLTSGTYTLLTYGGDLTNNGARFGLVPAGYNLLLVAGGNAVDVIVDYEGIQWWDGARTTPGGDPNPQGGSGTWDANTTNWTNASASANTAWAGLVARFSGTAGTVNVASNVEIAGLQFAVDGYTLADDGGTLIVSGSTAELFVNPDATAEVAAVLSGSGRVIKAGGGKLILSGSNTYEGGTTLSQGTLEIASDSNLGASSGGLTLGGGTLRTTASFTSARSVTLEGLGTIETATGTLSFTGPVTGAGGFVKSGSGTLVLNGSLGYQSLTQVNEGTLEFQGGTASLSGNLVNNGTVIFNQSAASAYGGIVSGTGALTKNGAALLDVTGSLLTHSGVTTVNSGTLAAKDLPNSTLHLAGGAFSPGGANAIASITVGGLTLDGGGFAFDLGSGGVADLITIADGAAALNAATLFTFNDLGGANGIYHLFSGLSAGWDLSLLDFDGITVPSGTFLLGNNGTDLYFSIYDGSPVTGPLLQNSGPVGTPTAAEFFVIGPVETGTPSESNTVNSLTFEDESSLLVHNTLTVTSGSFAVIDGTAALTGGTVATPGGFTQTGLGKLISDTFFQVGGTATIQSGQLVVNGTFSAPGGVVISPNGLLGGSGLIDGNLFNHGTVSPGNSPGTLTVAGDYVQTGNFLMEIGGKNDFDRLIVGGEATLDGALIVLPYHGYEIEYGQKFTFLESAKLSGAFDETILPSGLRGRILEDDGDATLLVAPESYTQAAVTQNQKNVAKALDHYISATGGDREKVSIALDHLKANEYPDAFNQIAPTFYESLALITVEQSNAQGQMLQQRFGSQGLAPRGFSQSGLEMPIVAEASGKTYTGKDLKEARDIMEPAATNPWSVWIQGNGLFAKNAGIDNVPNYRFDSGGFLLGADYQWNARFATGLYAGYQGTRARYDGGGHTDIDAARFGGYATFKAGNGFYANALIGGGHSSYDVRRPIDFGSIDRTARSTPSGGEFSTMIGSGYDWKASNFVFGPVASLQYTYVAIDGFTETGAKSLDLRLDDQDVHSLRSTLGARIAYTWQLAPGVALIPELRATWQHEFLQGSETFSAALDGGGPAFNYATATPGRDALFAGAGLNLLFGDRWSANVFYNADCASGDFKSQMVSGGVSVKF